ncbi:hypothetical protein [Bradyrhizobium sp. RT3a]|uniref:hypothetical protein n=1 Tax=unclassified Bradyrhizobium TaxID=2631580 RepID=UPI003393A80E
MKILAVTLLTSALIAAFWIANHDAANCAIGSAANLFTRCEPPPKKLHFEDAWP